MCVSGGEGGKGGRRLVLELLPAGGARLTSVCHHAASAQVILEVVRGNNPYLDVALDNIMVRRGPCAGKACLEALHRSTVHAESLHI